MTETKKPIPLDDAALDQVTGGVVALNFEYSGDWTPPGGDPSDQDPPDDEVVPEARSGNRGGS
ncbi:hypothetical protein [Falsiroseomonas tokyonensis]|uniref:Benenodin family lasso peptide n=1 Tax=Falsiroseomonas tokyonensis TaxID=430521 RepID=A0ABV7BPQ7_9PROT|nr:hypothetical protein [Falsiroseomonas tokyonensis]MBU8537585.1 hypothetical protein [Falsiroseomonas tokyonensis]